MDWENVVVAHNLLIKVGVNFLPSIIYQELGGDCCCCTQDNGNSQVEFNLTCKKAPQLRLCRSADFITGHGFLHKIAVNLM